MDPSAATVLSNPDSHSNAPWMKSLKIGMDPMDIRIKNAMKSGQTTVNGQYIPSTGLEQCRSDSPRKRLGQSLESNALWSRSRCRLFHVWLGRHPIYPNDMPQSGVQLLADCSGRITVYCGASDIGQGSDSMLAYIVAEETGVNPEHVIVFSSDTVFTPVDLGAYSSRVTYMCGIAAQEAAGKLRAQMKQALAAHWEVPEDQIGVALGSWYDKKDSGRQLPVKDVLVLTEAAAGCPLSVSGGYRTCKVHANGQPVGAPYRGGTIGASPAYSTTAHVAEVTVDPETGIVTVEKVWVAHDCGKALNPTLVEGQIEGSVYMGCAEAIMEAQRFSEKGLHLGPNLLDYRMPTSMETPDILARMSKPSIRVDYGAKEAGEGPLHPIIPAIANAIWDAVEFDFAAFPLPPSACWRRFRRKATLRMDGFKPTGPRLQKRPALYHSLETRCTSRVVRMFCPTLHRIFEPGWYPSVVPYPKAGDGSGPMGHRAGTLPKTLMGMTKFLPWRRLRAWSPVPKSEYGHNRRQCAARYALHLLQPNQSGAIALAIVSKPLETVTSSTRPRPV